VSTSIDRKKQEFPPARIWMPARDGVREGWYNCTGRSGTSALTAFRVASVVEYEHEDARQTRWGTGRIWIDLHLDFVTVESA